MLRFDVQVPVITPRSDPGAIDRAQETGALLVLRDVVAASPGGAAKHWKYAQTREGTYAVFSREPLSRWLEYGTKPHMITRKGAILSGGPRGSKTHSPVVAPGRDWYGPGGKSMRVDYFGETRMMGPRTGRPMLRIPISDSGGKYRFEAGEEGEYTFTPQVHHPGIKPRFYLRTAVQENQMRIANLLEEAARDMISGELGVVPGAGGKGSGRYKLRSGTRFTARIR